MCSWTRTPCVWAHLYSYSTRRVSSLYEMESPNGRLLTQARAQESTSRHRNLARGQSSATVREKVPKQSGKRARSTERVRKEADTEDQSSAAASLHPEPAEATGEMGDMGQSSGQGALDTRRPARQQRGLGQQLRQERTMAPPPSRGPRILAGGEEPKRAPGFRIGPWRPAGLGERTGYTWRGTRT